MSKNISEENKGPEAESRIQGIQGNYYSIGFLLSIFQWDEKINFLEENGVLSKY